MDHYQWYLLSIQKASNNCKRQPKEEKKTVQDVPEWQRQT
jgi:hypothetical protein